MSSRTILHIEDNDADQILLALAFEAQAVSVKIELAKDGELAATILSEIAAGTRDVPDLVVLDLNIPKWSGLEILDLIRGNERTRNLPVVVLTSSDAPADRQQTDAQNVVAYLRKPMSVDGFMELATELLAIAESSARER